VDQRAAPSFFVVRQQPIHLPLTDAQYGRRRGDRPSSSQNVGQHFDPLQIAFADVTQLPETEISNGRDLTLLKSAYAFC
jgi:hypothetical protein